MSCPSPMWGGSYLQVLGVALPIVFTVASLTSAQTVFTQYPSNTAAPLNSNVTLTCASNEPAIIWEIDGIQLVGEATIREYAEDGIFFIPTVMEDLDYVSRLIVPATIRNNRTRLQCIAGPNEFTLDLRGEEITFGVFGEPLAPTKANLTAETLHQVTLSWGPPFTLPGEMVTYTVLIDNLNTSGTEIVEGLDTTSYTHSLTEEEAVLCHTYQFTVSSRNAVGLSENCTTAVGVYPSAPGSFGEITSKVILLQQNISEPQSKASAVFMFQTPHTCFPLTYNTTISNNGSTYNLGPFLYSGTGMEQITLSALQENAEYTATVSANNEFQFSTQSEEQAFYTTDVQTVSLQSFENGTLQTTCTFAEGTAARGCQVTITFNQLADVVQRVDRTGDEVEVTLDQLLNPGDTPCAVVARDIEMDNSLGSFNITGSVIINGVTTTRNCCTLNILDNIQVLNNTDPDNVLLTCVDGFTPEEVILVQCINGAWHPDPATLNCTSPIRESGNNNIFVVIVIPVVCVLVLLFTLLLVVLLVAWYRKKALKRKQCQRNEATNDVVSGQETVSANQQGPQSHDTIVENLQLQQNEAYHTNVSFIPDKHDMALMMTLNAAYGCVTTSGHSDVNVVDGEQSMATYNNSAPDPDEEDEEYHYYY